MDVLIVRLEIGLFSLQTCEAETRRALNCITEVASGEDYSEVILSGHSMGGLLARKAYLAATDQLMPGVDQPHLTDADKATRQTWRKWGEKTTRVILLAPVNRGWQLNSYISNKLLIAAMWLADFWSNVWTHLLQLEPMIYGLRHGAPFLTQLRLEWMSLSTHPLTVQLLGTVDDIVAPEDNLDLFADNGFIYLEVPDSGHGNIVRMDDSAQGRKRKEIWLEALTADQESLTASCHHVKDSALSGADYDLLRRGGPDASVEDVVFVIHGIRDAGYWTSRIAQRIMRQDDKKWAAITSSYGYFAMGPFLFPWYRRRKVEWLADQYVRAKALYPKAQRIHFVGHSNGTYLCSDALERYPGIRFSRIVFAGSVVRCDFDWPKYIREGRVEKVLNYTATADWVVGFFPRALEPVKFFNLGSAGHNDFSCQHPDVIKLPQHVRGGHGAALVEDNWKAIAEFVTGRNPAPEIPHAIAEKSQNPAIKLLALFPAVIWAGIFAVLFFIGGSLLSGDFSAVLGRWAEILIHHDFGWRDNGDRLVRVMLPWESALKENTALNTTLFLGYMAALWKVLTKF